MPTDILPKKDDFKRTLGAIYTARSKATHVGAPFPASATYAGGPTMNALAAHMLFGTDSPFPPVAWFERIVQSAISGYWERAIQAPQGCAVNSGDSTVN
jgi:hypothetical protein